MSPTSLRPSTDRTRRRVLTQSGAALATLLSSTTAGCLSSLPPLGDEQRYGRVSVPAAGDPTYRKWFPAPSAVDQRIANYHFTTLDSPSPRPEAPEKFIAGQAYAKASTDYFGIGFQNYDRFISCNFGTVITATFDRDSVVQTITDSGYEQTTEYSGYTVCARSDIPRRVAVGNDVIVWTSSYHHESPNLRALIDAGAGDRPRYHEANPGFNALTTAAGANPYLAVNTAVHDPTDRPVMLADALRFDDDTAYQVVQYYYRQPDRVPTKQVLTQALQTDEYRFLDGAETFDVELADRLATVETRAPLTSARDIPPEYNLPQVTWGVTYDTDVERVTFRHEAGDSVPGDRLFYDLDRPSAPGRIDRQPLWDGVATVEPGAEATVDLRDDPDATGVSLVYSPGDIDFYVLLGVGLRGETDG